MAERISLVEQYDNKDMIVQMKKCLDRTADAVTVSTEARDTAVTSAAEAHTASTNANAASTQAQTAAATVATYESRLGAAEDGVAGNRSSIQTIDGEITDIYNDLTNVIRKVGDPGQIVYNGLELRGTNRTPDTVVGQLNDFIVNAKRLIGEIESKLNAYAPMVRTSGTQIITGNKTLIGTTYIGDSEHPLQGTIQIVTNSAYRRIKMQNVAADVTQTPTETVGYPIMAWTDANDVNVCTLLAQQTPDGKTRLVAQLRNVNGTSKTVVIGVSD